MAIDIQVYVFHWTHILILKFLCFSGSKQRREFRNDKYGFGGRKKGTKKNTSDSLNDFNVSDINARGSKKSKGKMISKHGAAKRLGKERRAKGKGGGKRK